MLDGLKRALKNFWHGRPSEWLGEVYVREYVKGDGTRVKAHTRRKMESPQKQWAADDLNQPGGVEVNPQQFIPRARALVLYPPLLPSQDAYLWRKGIGPNNCYLFIGIIDRQTRKIVARVAVMENGERFAILG